MRLLLIRHAETIDNVHGAIASVLPGPDLTERGRVQAAALAAALADEPIDAVYASAATRATQTAEPLAAARGLHVTVLPGLHEITGGDFETRTDAEALRGYLGTVITWWADFGARIPAGEDGHEFFARFTAAIDAIAATGVESAAVFSHGGSIRTWASGTSTNLDEAFSRTHGLENTGVVRLEGSPAAGWVVTEWQSEPVSAPEA